MRFAIHPPTGSIFAEIADEIAELEAVGIDAVVVPEAYSFDAVSQLGYLAARTSRRAHDRHSPDL